MSTQTGATCPSQAEDAIADAFARTTAWQELTETTTTEEAVAKIYFNALPLPADLHAFTLDELLERRVAMLVLIDPEEGFSVTPGEAQGVIYEGGRVIALVERSIRDNEVSNDTIDQNRFLLDKLVSMMVEATEYLLATKGQRWMQPMRLQQPPTLNHYKLGEVEGVRQYAAISVAWGQSGDQAE